MVLSGGSVAERTRFGTIPLYITLCIGFVPDMPVVVAGTVHCPLRFGTRNKEGVPSGTDDSPGRTRGSLPLPRAQYFTQPVRVRRMSNEYYFSASVSDESQKRGKGAKIGQHDCSRDK